MKTYRVEAMATVEIVTMVEAESREEAEQIASDRELDICIHGSEYAEGYASTDNFVLSDGGYHSVEINSIEEE